MDVSLNNRTKQAECAKHGAYESKGITFGHKTIWMGCPKCGEEAKREHDEKEAQLEAEARQRRLENRLNQAGIPQRFRARSFDNYVADTEEKKRALSVAMEFAANFDQHRKDGTVVVFSGRPGTGKSHLATAAAQVILKRDTAMYISAIDAVRMVRNTWRRDSQQSETQVLNTLASVDLLILDEVGVQYGTESEQVTLFDIIDKRYRDQMPTILLTNLGTKEMKEFLGDRSYDRLREGGMWIKFDWESHRGKAAA